MNGTNRFAPGIDDLQWSSGLWIDEFDAYSPRRVESEVARGRIGDDVSHFQVLQYVVIDGREIERIFWNVGAASRGSGELFKLDA